MIPRSCSEETVPTLEISNIECTSDDLRVVLNIATGMTWPWFGPIANEMVDEFGITLNQVNWLGNIMGCVYLPVSLCVPVIVSAYGVRRCCDVGAVTLLLSAWIRYAATADGLSKGGAYALLLLGQTCASIAQPIFQVLAPKYSETWFDLKTRTTATMVIAMANPIGGAVGQLLSPLVGTPRQSILVLGVISSVAAPGIFVISAAPPSPPTYSASKKSSGLSQLLQQLCGRSKTTGSDMTIRERVDFILLLFIFGVLSATTNDFSILTAEILQPVGYSATTSGLMGAVLLLAGIFGAAITAPLFDRVFTHHLAVTTKIFVPVSAAGWLSLVWAVRPHNSTSLFVIMAILGISALSMLPVGLELACELTRNAEGSAALMWFSCNLLSVVFILIIGTLRAGPEASPPLNMRRSLIFSGVLAMISGGLSLLIRGKQARKEMDESELQRHGAVTTTDPSTLTT
ncbi:Major facilitator superfamily domain-containing protein 7 [Mycena sanguinolenta]|uniref:Major facilitator superfamily domain-containing protein 7 n=1 Tax=Mycena sanguinolenta TaxID=230812 RepID=A0A8H7D402_9AGAR|nr:Major facilitator superfamily domain-containing protein 7 [Mycena sanguinolenta]